jgi:hypothetical protein
MEDREIQQNTHKIAEALPARAQATARSRALFFTAAGLSFCLGLLWFSGDRERGVFVELGPSILSAGTLLSAAVRAMVTQRCSSWVAS